MRIVAGVLGLLTAAALTGCAATAPAPPPATVTVATPAPAAPPVASTTTSDTPQSSGPCRLDQVRADLGSPTVGDGSPGSGTVEIVWTNTSQQTCTMRGFGGADLARTPASRAELPEPERTRPDRFSLRRTDAQAATVRLAPGEKAHGTIRFSSGDRDVESFQPDQLFATPPNETRSAVLTWPRSVSVLHDGATIGPIEPGTS